MLSEKKECTVNDLCKYYGVTRTTIERWCKRENGLPFIKKGRRVYFVVEDIENWFIENNKVVKYNYKEEKTSVN